MSRHKAAIIGSGNIGTDLMYKILRKSAGIELAAMVGIDPTSDGLARAAREGIATTSDGVDGLLRLPCIDELSIVFDATSAKAHVVNEALLRPRGIRMIDLTPAAIGPYVVPVVNLDEHIDAPNVNMVTCGGQATIPMVAAVSRIAPVIYAEIIASVSSRSAGPGTRANIDEFTQTTAQAIERVGGARRGKAIIILNPAEPPLIMRDTIFVLSEDSDEKIIEASVHSMIADVQRYVPGYRLKQALQFEHFSNNNPIRIPGRGSFTGLKTSIYIEIEGAAHYLPAYAGNLDIMTSAALATGERIAESRRQGA